MAWNDTADRRWLLRSMTCGVVAVALLYLIGMLIASVFKPLRSAGQSVICQANLMRQARAFRMYAMDYRDALPPAAGWMDRTAGYLDRLSRLHCPTAAAGDETVYGYGMNRALGGVAPSSVSEPGKAALVFDSRLLGRSEVTDLETLPRPGRHASRGREGTPPARGNFVARLDGSVKLETGADGSEPPDEPDAEGRRKQPAAPGG